MPAPLLLDIGCLCDEHTDATLEFMAKAVGEPPGDDIWAPHPNPFIRRIVELFTQRGLDRIDGIDAELRQWLAGGEGLESALAPRVRPDGILAMRRWAPAEVGLMRAYLRNLPREQFTLDDWMALVDYLVQRYLPEGDLRTEAEWLATRSSMMGRVQAAMGAATEAEAETVLAALPSTVDAAARDWSLTPDQRAVIDFGRARCCEHVTALAEGVRLKLRKLVVDYQENAYLGNRAETNEALQTKLLDSFGEMNRDWRRIAVTEATENVNQGYVASKKPGDKIKRVEKYRGACGWCRSIDGKIVTVVDPAIADKDGDNQVWIGKTNVGRSASPRKRSGGELVEREPNEMWWIAAGAQHPHCRGAWVDVVEGVSADPIFEAWLLSLKKNRGRA
jgi:hypothetical protein